MKATCIWKNYNGRRDDILECVCLGWDEAKARAFIDTLPECGEFRIFSVKLASKKEVELYADDEAGDIWIEWFAPHHDNPEGTKYPFLAPDFLESFNWEEKAVYDKGSDQ